LNEAHAPRPLEFALVLPHLGRRSRAATGGYDDVGRLT